MTEPNRNPADEDADDNFTSDDTRAADSVPTDFTESDSAELESLIFDADDGALDRDSLARLRTLLRSGPAARQVWVSHRLLGAALRDLPESKSPESKSPESKSPESKSPESNVLGSRPAEFLAAETRVRAPQSDSGGSSLAPDSSASVSWRRVYFGAVVAFVAASLVWFMITATEFGTSRDVDLARADPDALERQARWGDASFVSGLKPGAISSFPAADATEPTASGIAVITRLVDATWPTSAATVPTLGDALDPGRFTLDSGLAQIEFFCGATVVVEGPAVLDLKHAMLLRMHRGRLRAVVPPAARGFTVDVADMKVVDLGTEFGLRVSDAGADVQVFDGQVAIHSASGGRRDLFTGDAVARSVDGTLTTAETRPGDYVDVATLNRRDRSQESTRYARWRKWADVARDDPRLIAFYPFADTAGSGETRVSDRVLVNEARSRRRGKVTGPEPPDPPAAKSPRGLQANDLDGAIVGAQAAAGRWADKRSLDFKQPGDRVRVLIPGDFGSLSLAAWVKIDSPDRRFNSLFLTDNYDAGEPHWQILHNGQLYFSVRPSSPGAEGPRDQKILSPPFWTPSLSGRWIHLATTFDLATGVTVHYLNGNPIHREVVPPERRPDRVRIGPASIGNWSMPTQADASFAIRNLNGSVDELALYAAALSAEEIREVFRNGRP